MNLYAPDNAKTERLLKRLADWKKTNPNWESLRPIKANKEAFYFGEEINKFSQVNTIKRK